jgi:hypothetical protein
VPESTTAPDPWASRRRLGPAPGALVVTGASDRSGRHAHRAPMRSRFGPVEIISRGLPDGSLVVVLDLHGAPVWEPLPELVPASPGDG